MTSLGHLAPLHRFRNLSHQRVQEVINDFNLLRQGARLYFAVDPHDVFDFCFPFDPAAGVAGRVPDIDRIADEQAGLWEIFFGQKERPLLIAEYVSELKGLASYIEGTVKHVYTRLELLDGMIDLAGVPDLPRSKSVEALLVAAEEHLHVALAVFLGIYSLGLERFRDVVTKRLAFSTPDSPTDAVRKLLHSVFGAYEPTELVGTLRQLLALRRSGADAVRSTREQANRADARALDQLLYVNHRLAGLYHDGKLNERHVILYLSTAPRSEAIFGAPGVRAKLPVIDGEPYRILRTRDQLFLYALYLRRKQAQRKGYGRAIEELKEVQRVLDESGRLRAVVTGQGDEDCAACVVQGGYGDECRWRPFCEKLETLKKRVDASRVRMLNVGLLRALVKYRDTAQDVKRPTKNSQEAYFTFVKSLLNEGRLEAAAGKRFRSIQDEIAERTAFASSLPSAYEGLRDRYRFGRDAVTSLVQYLPIRPRVRRDVYRSIIAEVLNHYRSGGGNIEGVRDAYTRYLGLDADAGTDDYEHEVVRCLLYLAFPSTDGDEKAFEHAVRMLGAPGWDAEFRYVACWAGRRARRYPEAEEYGRRALRSYPKDARFFHGRGLNIVAWHMDSKAKPACPLRLGAAVEAFEAAAKLYARERDRPRDLVGICFNDVAYTRILMLEDKVTPRGADATTLLKAARRAVEELKRWIVKSTWVPDYPECFHTEALVAYQEYLFGTVQGIPVGTRRKVLEGAQRDIGEAVKIVAKDRYRELKEQIERALASLPRVDRGRP
jgi:tetratricopeptide (TPR) repeat protein